MKVEIVHWVLVRLLKATSNWPWRQRPLLSALILRPMVKHKLWLNKKKFDVRYYSVIYEALDEVQKAMAGMLAPLMEERYLGKAEVRMVIAVSKHGKIAGCYVLDGKIIRSAKVRLQRKNQELSWVALEASSALRKMLRK